jgi:hypothetical protein
VPNIAFSISAAAACVLVAVLAAVKDAPVVAAVWAVLACGFVLRAVYGARRKR